jgi:hypothetical protein
MYMREAFPTKCIWYKCNARLRYKDAYTSWYICNANARMHKRKAIHTPQKSSQHQLKKPTTHKAHKRPAPRGEAKGLDNTDKIAKEQKTHKLPLNTCIRDKEHTKLTLSTLEIGQRAKQTEWLDQCHTLEGHQFTYLDHSFRSLTLKDRYGEPERGGVNGSR